MFQELRNMRLRLTVYYTLILVLFISAFIGFVFYILFHTNGFDRELKINAAMVYDLNKIPDINEIKPDVGQKPDDGKHAEEIFKFILRDENMHITKSSIHYQALFQCSQALAQKTWLNQKKYYDTISLDGNVYRLYSIPFHKNNQNGVVQTYCNLTIIEKFNHKFSQMLFAIVLGAIVLASFIGWWLAGWAMMPVKLAWHKQKQFIADVSHELRTPLTVIQSNLDVALADRSGSINNNINWLQNAYSETMSMGKLTNDLLLIARIDAREIKFEHNELDLSALLNQMAFQFEPLFLGKSLSFFSNIEAGVKMHGDEVRIKQMVSIFLDNASKYTPEGGRVDLKLRKTQNTIEIIVADNGIGFDESEKEKIFKRFYRIDKARSRKQGGTGLGLAIADWIVKKHNGMIRVFSRPGEGSIFKVILPNYK